MTVELNDDFEDATDFDNAYEEDGDCSVVDNDTAYPLSGSRNMKASVQGYPNTNAYALFSESLDSIGNTIYMSVKRFRFDGGNIDANGENIRVWTIGSFGWYTGACYFGVWNDSGTLKWFARLYQTAGWQNYFGSGGPTPAADTNYAVECKFYSDNTAGTIDMWVNGIQVIQQSSLDTNDRAPDFAWFGLAYEDGNNVVWMDDAYIGDVSGDPFNNTTKDLKCGFTVRRSSSQELKAGFNVRWCDGFEDGNDPPDNWDGVIEYSGDAINIITTDPYSGTYHAEADLAGDGTSRACVYKDGSWDNTIYCRGRFKLKSNLPSGSTGIGVIDFLAGSQIVARASFRTSVGFKRLFLYYIDGASLDYTETPYTYNLDEWYTVQLYLKVAGGTSGEARLYVNGELQIEETGLDTDNYGDVTRFRLGCGYSDIPAAHEVYFDTICISSEYIDSTFDDSEDFKAGFTVRHSASQDLGALFEVGQGSQDFKAILQIGTDTVSEDFETGGVTAPFDDIAYGGSSITWNCPKNGTYGASCNIGGGPPPGPAYIQIYDPPAPHIPPMREVYTILWVKFGSVPSSSGDHIPFCRFFASGTLNGETRVHHDGSNPVFAIYKGSGGSATYLSSKIVSAGTWYRVQWRMKRGDTDGAMELWVDGINEISQLNIDTHHAGQKHYQTGQWGWMDIYEYDPGTICLDDIAYDDEYIDTTFDGSEDFKAGFEVRHETSQDLKGILEVRRSASQDFKAGLWTPGQIESLKAGLTVRQSIPRYMLTDRFDDGDYSGWTLVTSGSATLSVTTNRPFSGGYSVEATSPSPGALEDAYLYRIVSPTEQLHIRLRFNLEDLISTDNRNTTFLEIGRPGVLGVAANLGFAKMSGEARWRFIWRDGGSVNSETLVTSNPPAADTWFVAEIIFDAINSTITWELDGDQINQKTSLDLSDIQAGRVEIGISGEFCPDDITVWIDDVEVWFPYERVLKGEFTVRQEASEDLKAGFEVRRSSSQGLKGLFDVRRSASQNLLGEFTSRQASSQDLLGEFTVRQSDSQNLKGLFDVQRSASQEFKSLFTVRRSGFENLLGEFISRQASSRELKGLLDVRRSDSQELKGLFDVRRSAFQNLLGEFTSRQASSQELKAGFTVRQESTEDFKALFEIRRSSSQDLLAGFTSQLFQDASQNLKGILTSRQSASQELKGLFTVRQSGSENLKGVLDIRRSASEDFKATFTVRQSASENLLGGFISQQVNFQDLPGEFISRQAFSRDFKGLFEVRRSSSEELLGEFITRHPDSQDLLGIFVSRQESSEELKAGFTVKQASSENLKTLFSIQRSASEELKGLFDIRRSASQNLKAGLNVVNEGYSELLAYFTISGYEFKNLYGKFDVGQNSRSLKAEFVTRHSSSQELLGEFISRQTSTQNLPGVFEVRRSASQELLGELISRHASFEELKGLLTVRQSSSEDVLGEFVSRQSETRELKAGFSIRRDASENLLGEFISRQESSEELKGFFTVRQSASEDLKALFDIRRSSSQEFKGLFEVQHASSEDLLGEFITRHSTSSELLGSFTLQRDALRELFGLFSIRRTSSAELLAGFIVRQPDLQDLKGSFVCQHPDIQELLGQFSVRRSSSQELLAGFIPSQSGSEDLPCGFNVRNASIYELSAWFEIRQVETGAEEFVITDTYRGLIIR